MDTGCEETLVWQALAPGWERCDTVLTAVNGSTVRCCGRMKVDLAVNGLTAAVEVVVVPARLMGVDMLLGMTGIKALGGVSVCAEGNARFGETRGVSVAAASGDVVRVAAPTRGRGVPETRGVSVSAASGDVGVASPTRGRGVPETRGVSVSAASGDVGVAAPTRGRGVPETRGVSVSAASGDAGVAVPTRGRGVPETTRGVSAAAASSVGSGLKIDEADFTASFDGEKWTVLWKWANGEAPARLENTTARYAVASGAKEKFEEEVRLWIKEGWLCEHDEAAHGPVRGLIPLMAVTQPAKDKVRPVLDYRELNQYLRPHTADADVCCEELRRWRRHGDRVAVIDLKKAFLQLHVDPALWTYQTVVVGERRYCLTRVGFGLSVAPLIMKAVVRTVLAQSPELARAVLPYADDLLVDESIVPADKVAQHFAAYGLACKPPERARATGGARMLGLHVAEDTDKELQWTRDGDTPATPPTKLTRRTIFAWTGQLTSHVPVAGWLRPAAAWLKRTANRLSSDWDTVIHDDRLQRQVEEVTRRVSAHDPARGQWCVTGPAVTVWTDASSIARGVVLTDPVTGAVLEDASWLRDENNVDMHINMSELDAALNGVNMAIAWGFRRLAIQTDSVTVQRWLSDALTGKARLRTKAQSEMLIRRRVAVFRQLVTEYDLEATVALVPSAANRADELTRVPREWLQQSAASSDMSPPPPGPAAAAAVTAVASAEEVHAVHANVGHQGVRRTLWYARRELGTRRVTRTMVREVVRRCQTCASIDPAPERWTGGSLSVERTWDRVAMDVTHVGGKLYLTLVDCGPSRYAIWRRLRHSGAQEIAQHLENIFLERGAPAEILTDNATEFRGRVMMALAARWDVIMRYRAAYEPGGNGVVERHHRTIKVMVARQSCTPEEAVHRYNVTPKDATDPATAPINEIFRHAGHDVDVALRSAAPVPAVPTTPMKKPGVYQVGDTVWVRRRGDRCFVKSATGIVTGIVSAQTVEVDGMPYHVRNLRHRMSTAPVRGPVAVGPMPVWSDDDDDDDEDEDDGVMLLPERASPPATVVSEPHGRPPNGDGGERLIDTPAADTTCEQEAETSARVPVKTDVKLELSELPEKPVDGPRRGARERRAPERYGESASDGDLDAWLFVT